VTDRRAHSPLNVSDGNKAKEINHEASAINQAAERILASVASGKIATESDLKMLEAKVSEKIEVTAKSILDATNAFTAALATITGVPHPSQSKGWATQDLNAPPRAIRHHLPEERASLTHKFGIAGP